MKSFRLALLASVLAVSGFSAQAASLTLNVNYFTVANGDADFNTQCCGTYSNLIKGTLGANGLPVYNAGYGGPAISDVNASTNEITWWSPSLNSNVTYTGSGVVTVPYSNSAFYPTNGSGPNDANGFQTAVFSGSLVVPEKQKVTFTFGADDDAFLAINDSVIAQLGGVHANTAGPVTSTTLDPGTYSLTLFYADRFQSQASLNFSVDTAGIGLSAVPLPGSAPMFGAALLGLAGLGYTVKRKKAATAV